MTQDEIISMAREAGAGIGTSGRWLVTQDELQHFAALVATAEREACALLVEKKAATNWVEMAAAIRKQGKLLA